MIYIDFIDFIKRNLELTDNEISDNKRQIIENSSCPTDFSTQYTTVIRKNISRLENIKYGLGATLKLITQGEKNDHERSS